MSVERIIDRGGHTVAVNVTPEPAPEPAAKPKKTAPPAWAKPYIERAAALRAAAESSGKAHDKLVVAWRRKHAELKQEHADAVQEHQAAHVDWLAGALDVDDALDLESKLAVKAAQLRFRTQALLRHEHAPVADNAPELQQFMQRNTRARESAETLVLKARDRSRHDDNARADLVAALAMAPDHDLVIAHAVEIVAQIATVKGAEKEDAADRARALARLEEAVKLAGGSS